MQLPSSKGSSDAAWRWRTLLLEKGCCQRSLHHRSETLLQARQVVTPAAQQGQAAGGSSQQFRRFRCRQMHRSGLPQPSATNSDRVPSSHQQQTATECQGAADRGRDHAPASELCHAVSHDRQTAAHPRQRVCQPAQVAAGKQVVDALEQR